VVGLWDQGRQWAVDTVDACRALARLKDNLGVVGETPKVRVGRYEILGLVGSGGFGRVYRARDPKLNRDVAVKAVPLPPGDCPIARQQVRDEARMLAQLCHPNVVAIYDVSTERVRANPSAQSLAGGYGREFFIVMEYLRGCTLEAWLAGGSRSSDEILDAFTEAGRGLDAAHRRGVLHRDFKPSNVIRCDDGRVVVLDFGLATLRDHATLEADDELASDVTVGAAGTPMYMPPEQHQALPATPEGDVFAFSAALFHALFGTVPFAGRSLAELWQDKRKGPPTPPSAHGIEPRVVAAVLEGLRPNPRRRWSSMTALLDAIEEARFVRRKAGTRIFFAAAVALGIFGAAWPEPSERAPFRQVDGVSAEASATREEAVARVHDRTGDVAYRDGDSMVAEHHYELGYYAALAAGDDHRALAMAASVAGLPSAGRSLEETRRWVGIARALAERVGAKGRNVAIAQIGLGHALLLAGRYEESIAELKRTDSAIVLGDRDETLGTQLLFDMGTAMLYAGRHDEAVSVLAQANDRIRQHQPDFPDALEAEFALGAALRSAGHHARSEGVLRSVIERSDEELSNRAKLALALLLTEHRPRLEESLRLLDDVAASVESHDGCESVAYADLLATRAKVLLRGNEVAAAERAYRSARSTYDKHEVDAARLQNIDEGLLAVADARSNPPAL